MRQVHLLNIGVHSLPLIDLLEKLKLGGVVFTPNVDHLIQLQKDYEFYQAYHAADYRICDSKVLFYASCFLGTPIREKIAGSDLFPAFYTHYRSDLDVKIFLLGAAPGVADVARQKINEKIGREIIVAAHSPSYGFERKESECQQIIDLINQSGATVLAVGLGAPKQEKWIVNYRSALPKVKTFLAIGATLDFEAGNIQRSPKWMSEAGLEWLFRIWCEPRRLWKRYLVRDMPIFWLLVQQLFRVYQNPWLSDSPLASRSFVKVLGSQTKRFLKRPSDALYR